MYIIANIFFLFLFILIIFFLKFPNINNNQYILHKIILFISIFSFQFMIQIISKIRYKCKIYINDIATDSLLVATAAIIGYSIYNDLVYTNVINYDYNYKQKYLIVSLFIIAFIIFVKIFKLILNSPASGECINYN